jgi:hypothetical protein
MTDLLDMAPTELQFARIGRIHVTWAITEKLLQSILSRLGFAPDWPGGALSDPLIFEHRLGAIDALIEIHRVQFGCHYVSAAECDQIVGLRKSLAKLRPFRNRLAHWVVFRDSDDRVGVARFATRVASQDREDFVFVTVSDLNNHIKEIGDVAAKLTVILLQLKAQPSPFERKRHGK